jgi:hypothetical protein
LKLKSEKLIERRVNKKIARGKSVASVVQVKDCCPTDYNIVN